MTRRKNVGIGAALVVALGLVGFFVFRAKQHERGFIVGFRAVEAGGAVIVWRANHDEGPSTGWVSRVDATGHEIWTRSLPNIAMSGGTGPIAVVDGAAIIRYGTRDPEREFHIIANAAIAFDLEKGDQLWDHVIAEYVPHTAYDGRPSELSGLPLYVSQVPLGRLVVAYSDTGEHVITKAVVARTGAIVWEQPSSEMYAGPIAIGTSGFATHFVANANLTDAATGKVVTLDVDGPGCVIGDEYIAVTNTVGKPRALVAFHADGSRSRVIAEPFEAFTMPYPHVDSCGRYKDRFVFFMDTLSPRRRSVVITDAHGVLLHEIPLGDGVNLMHDVHMTDPAHAYLSGDLPRFVPFPDGTLKNEANLVMLDLESGTVAWRAPADDRLLYGSLFRSGSHWIWFDGSLSSTISVFDGATGKLAAATRAYSYKGIFELGSRGSTFVASGDTLWVYSGDWTTPDAAPIVALELPTLKPRFPPRIIELTDATEAVRAKLKLP